MTVAFSKVRSNLKQHGKTLVAMLVAAGFVLGSSVAVWAQPGPPKKDTDVKKPVTPEVTPKAPDPTAATNDKSVDPATLELPLILKAIVDDSLSTGANKKFENVENVEEAIVRFKAQDFDNARKMLKLAKTENPLLPPGGVMMAKMLFLAKLNQYGMAELEQTMISDPDDPEAYLMEADILFSQGYWSAAHQMFTKGYSLAKVFGTKDKPTTTPSPKRQTNFEIKVFAGTAAVAEAQKKWESAQDFITRWIKLDKENPAAHLRLGRVNFKMNDLVAAMDEFKTAETLSNAKKEKDAPKGMDPFIVMAKLYLEETNGKDDKVNKDNRQKAIDALNQAVSKKVGDLDTQLQAAAGFLQAKSLDKAQTAVDAAVAADKDNTQARYLKAVVLRMKGKLSEAETILESLHADAPGDFGITNQLALVLTDSNKLAKQRIALQHASNNFNSNQKNAEAACTLAWCLYKAGETDKALEIMGQVAKQTQLSADSAYYIAVILKEKENTKEAKKILSEAMKIDAPFFVHEQDAKDLLARMTN